MKQRLPTVGGGYKIYRSDPDATKGAQVGVDLKAPDGSLVKWADILNPPASQEQANFNGTSDDVPEGQFNLYFTNERAQDAVGLILQNSANVTLTYNDTANTITADLTNVTPTSGGSIFRLAFDGKGRLLQQAPATTDNLTEGSTNLYFTKFRVSTSLIAGDGISLSVDGLGNTTINNSAFVTNMLTSQAGDQLTDQTGTNNLKANSSGAQLTPLPSYTLATLPSVSVYQYCLIIVTDLTGGLEPCFSDGTNWRRCSDKSIAN